VTTTERAEYIPTKDVAKLIRRHLKAAFPGVTFSVRTQSYSMGSHVSVSWTDGPSTVQVDQAIGHYCGKTFDGSDDSTHHHDVVVIRETGPALVHYSGSASSTYRRVTDETAWRERAGEMLRSRLDGITGGGDRRGQRWGNDWLDNLITGMVYACDFREAEPLERAYRSVILREDG
jgi:conjugative element/phage-associated large polyvalent protein